MPNESQLDERDVPAYLKKLAAARDELLWELRGDRLARVVYWDFWENADGPPSPFTSDFGEWHEVSFGIDFVTERGAVFHVTWNSLPTGTFFLDVQRGAMWDGSEPGATGVFEMADHPRWTGVVGKRMVAMKVRESDWVYKKQPMDLEIRFETGAAVWLGARGSARPEDRNKQHFASEDGDNVIVVFEEKLAREIGMVGG